MGIPRQTFPQALLVLIFIQIIGCKQSTEPTQPLTEGSYRDVRSAWGPDGRQICFRGERNGVRGLYLLDTAGLSPSLLLQGEGIGASWSPDGRWLSYSALGSLYRIRATGDSVERLTNSGSDIRPVWSPDGKRIAFVRSGVWLLSLDSLVASSLTGFGNFPCWTPAADEVMVLDVVNDVYSGALIYSIVAVNAGTQAIRVVAQFQTNSNTGYSSLSPNGNEMVFGVQPPSGLTQIWKLDLTTRQFSQLTSDGGDYPAWSPNGKMIVYTRTASGDGGLWIMNADGSAKRRLT